MAKMGTRPEYLYFDIQLIIDNTARSKNEDEPVTITQWNDAETVNEEEENYEFDDITDDEVDDDYIFSDKEESKTLLDNSIDLIFS